MHLQRHYLPGLLTLLSRVLLSSSDFLRLPSCGKHHSFIFTSYYILGSHLDLIFPKHWTVHFVFTKSH